MRCEFSPPPLWWEREWKLWTDIIQVFRGIGGVAHKYYMLFQHHLPPPPSTYTSGGFLVFSLWQRIGLMRQRWQPPRFDLLALFQ